MLKDRKARQLILISQIQIQTIIPEWALFSKPEKDFKTRKNKYNMR